MCGRVEDRDQPRHPDRQVEAGRHPMLRFGVVHPEDVVHVHGRVGIRQVRSGWRQEEEGDQTQRPGQGGPSHERPPVIPEFPHEEQQQEGQPAMEE